MIRAKNKTKSKSTYFNFEYSEAEYSSLLKKFKSVSNLNKEKQKRIQDFIKKHSNTCFAKVRKQVYINGSLNSDITMFCNTHSISRAELSECVKKEML